MDTDVDSDVNTDADTHADTHAAAQVAASAAPLPLGLAAAPDSWEADYGAMAIIMATAAAADIAGTSVTIGSACGTGAVTAARPTQAPLFVEEFDGRVFLAPEAMERGLIDQIGYLDDALALAKELAGLPPNARVALFRRCSDRALTIYDVTPNIPAGSGIFPLSIPGLDRALLPTFLYMWQPEPLLEKTGGR